MGKQLAQIVLVVCDTFIWRLFSGQIAMVICLNCDEERVHLDTANPHWPIFHFMAVYNGEEKYSIPIRRLSRLTNRVCERFVTKFFDLYKSRFKVWNEILGEFRSRNLAKNKEQYFTNFNAVSWMDTVVRALASKVQRFSFMQDYT